MPLISVVVPVFRNEPSLKLTHENIRREILERLEGYDYEMIFVDDGSDDGSFERLQALRQEDRRVKIVKFSRNFGQLCAINAGLRRARGDLAVVISADLQDPAEMIPKMAREAERGHEIVIAQRSGRSDSALKNLAANLHWRLMRLTNPRFPKGGFDFWMVTRKALEAYKLLNDKMRSTQVDVLSIGFNVKFLPYVRLKRPFGKSQYSLPKLFMVSLNQILNTSYWVLRLSSAFGLLVTVLGFAYAVRLVYGYFFKGTPFRGWHPIMILILVLGGVTIFMLGIIGEYIWRIYRETKDRPLYIVSEELLD